MNKEQLIEKISQDADLSKKDAGNALNAFLSATTDALTNNDQVALIGFGTFKISKRAERQGRNPSTGSPLTVKACNVINFKAGKSLKEACN